MGTKKGEMCRPILVEVQHRIDEQVAAPDARAEDDPNVVPGLRGERSGVQLSVVEGLLSDGQRVLAERVLAPRLLRADVVGRVEPGDFAGDFGPHVGGVELGDGAGSTLAVQQAIPELGDGVAEGREGPETGNDDAIGRIGNSHEEGRTIGSRCWTREQRATRAPPFRRRGSREGLACRLGRDAGESRPEREPAGDEGPHRCPERGRRAGRRGLRIV